MTTRAYEDMAPTAYDQIREKRAQLAAKLNASRGPLSASASSRTRQAGAAAEDAGMSHADSLWQQRIAMASDISGRPGSSMAAPPLPRDSLARTEGAEQQQQQQQQVDERWDGPARSDRQRAAEAGAAEARRVRAAGAADAASAASAAAAAAEGAASALQSARAHLSATYPGGGYPEGSEFGGAGAFAGAGLSSPAYDGGFGDSLGAAGLAGHGGGYQGGDGSSSGEGLAPSDSLLGIVDPEAVAAALPQETNDAWAAVQAMCGAAMLSVKAVEVQALPAFDDMFVHLEADKVRREVLQRMCGACNDRMVACAFGLLRAAVHEEREAAERAEREAEERAMAVDTERLQKVEGLFQKVLGRLKAATFNGWQRYWVVEKRCTQAKARRDAATKRELFGRAADRFIGLKRLGTLRKVLLAKRMAVLQTAVALWQDGVDVPLGMGGMGGGMGGGGGDMGWAAELFAKLHFRWLEAGFYLFKRKAIGATAKASQQQEEGDEGGGGGAGGFRRRPPLGERNPNQAAEAEGAPRWASSKGSLRAGTGASSSSSSSSGGGGGGGGMEPYRLSGGAGGARSAPSAAPAGPPAGGARAHGMTGGGGRYHYDGSVLTAGLLDADGQPDYRMPAPPKASFDRILDWGTAEVTHWMFEVIVPGIPVERRQQSLLEGRHLLSLSDENLRSAAGAMLLPGTPLFFASQENRGKVLRNMGQLRGAAVRQVHAQPAHQPSSVVSKWGPEHVAWWLSVQAGFGQYVDAVWRHRIDGSQFVRFSAGDLEHTLGVAHRKHRLKLLHLIAELADRKLPTEVSAAGQLRDAGAGGVKSRAMLASVGIGVTDIGALSVADVVRLSPAAVAGWVTDVLKLPQYRDAFEQEGIGGKELLGLTDRRLRIDLQVPSRTHRQKLLEHIANLKHRQVHVDNASLSGAKRRMPKHYAAIQDEADAAPLMLLLQDRHQTNLKDAAPATRRAARRRQLDFEMWIAGVDSFAGTGPQPGSENKQRGHWPDDVKALLTRVCRAVGGSGLTLPEVFEAFKSHADAGDKLKRDEFTMVLRQMGMAPSPAQM